MNEAHGPQHENGKLLFMFCRFTGSWKAQVIGWLNLENVQKIINRVFFIDIHFLC